VRNGLEAVKRSPRQAGPAVFGCADAKLTGFDVLELIGPDVPVIFVTAYDEYAMKAFEVHAVDYLLKPVGKERCGGLAADKKTPDRKLPAPVELSAAHAPQASMPNAGGKRRNEGDADSGEKLEYAEAQDDYVALASDGQKH